MLFTNLWKTIDICEVCEKDNWLHSLKYTESTLYILYRQSHMKWTRTVKRIKGAELSIIMCGRGCQKKLCERENNWVFE